MTKCFLKALLDGIFGILSVTGHTLRNTQNSALVTFDQNFEGADVSALGGSDKRPVVCFRQNVIWRLCLVVFVNPVKDVGQHVLEPLPLKLRVTRGA